jgi:hypothetical protein
MLVNIKGQLKVSNTEQSTSTTTGALIVSGGVGIAKRLNVGGALGVTGATTLSSTLGVTGATTFLVRLELLVPHISSTLESRSNHTCDTWMLWRLTAWYLELTRVHNIGGTLGVTGATTLSSTLGVTGALTV